MAGFYKLEVDIVVPSIYEVSKVLDTLDELENVQIMEICGEWVDTGEEKEEEHGGKN